MTQEAKELIDEFATNVLGQNKSIMAGNSRKGNKHADKYFDCFQQLRKLPGGREAVSALLDHEDPGVRCVAAACLLKFKTREAMSTLEELAKGEGLVAFEANIVLSNWHDGTWNLDP